MSSTAVSIDIVQLVERLINVERCDCNVMRNAIYLFDLDLDTGCYCCSVS
jgi:hypothetical protein